MKLLQVGKVILFLKENKEEIKMLIRTNASFWEMKILLGKKVDDVLPRAIVQYEDRDNQSVVR